MCIRKNNNTKLLKNTNQTEEISNLQYFFDSRGEKNQKKMLTNARFIHFSLRLIRHATSQPTEVAIWSSVKKHQLQATKVVKRRRLPIQLKIRLQASMEVSHCRKVRFRRRRLQAKENCIYHHRRNQAHATRRTRRRRMSFTSRLTS